MLDINRIISPPREGEPAGTALAMTAASKQFGAADAEIKSNLLRTQRSKVLHLQLRVGQYIATRATLTVRDFFLAYFYPSGPFTCISSKTSPDFFLCWLWLTLVPV